MEITFETIRDHITENCLQAKVGEAWSFGLTNGSRIITELWNDELSIRLEDGEGYEIETQMLDFQKMERKELEQSVEYVLRCADRNMAA